jgi:hypothetical protein
MAPESAPQGHVEDDREIRRFVAALGTRLS